MREKQILANHRKKRSTIETKRVVKFSTSRVMVKRSSQPEKVIRKNLEVASLLDTGIFK